MNRRPRARAALLLVAALGLAGCRDDSSAPVAGPSSTSAAAGTSPTSPASPATPKSVGTRAGKTRKSSPSTSTPESSSSSADPVVRVEGIALTRQGTKLTLGQAAKITWHPDRTTVGVAKVRVNMLERVPIAAFRDWQLDAATRQSTPFYVHATVRNLGKAPLSGVRVPLYLLDGRGTLLQASTFRAPFPACPSTPLPAEFTTGRKTSVCLVYFAPDHGRLVAISFRPRQHFDAITWHGTVENAGT